MPIESLSQLRSWTPPVQRFIISSGILSPEGRLVLFGVPKAWKSIIALYTGFTIASASEWFGYSTNQTSVLVYQGEVSRLSQWKRVTKMSSSIPHEFTNIFFETATGKNVFIDRPYGYDTIKKSVDEARARMPGTLLTVILDPVYKLVSGNVADPEIAGNFTNNIDKLIAATGVSVIIVHHARKIKTDNEGKVIDLGSDDMFGGEIQKWCDTTVHLKLLNPKGNKDNVRVTFDLARDFDGETFPPSFDIHWSRKTLLPTVTNTYTTPADDSEVEVTARGLT